jgi:protein-disulfide isomerase
MKRISVGLSVVFLAAIVLSLAPMRTARADDPRMALHTIGDPKAPVRIDEYFSLDCPHCAEFAIDVLPTLKSDFIDKGKAYIVLHDFPLHSLALSAAMLARCAPGDRYIPMVETLFHVQRGWLLQTEGASLDALKQQARFAGLTDAQIGSCLSDQGLEDAVLKERLDAEKDLQINATPTFIFNQKSEDRIAAAGPYETFKNKIESLLRR